MFSWSFGGPFGGSPYGAPYGPSNYYSYQYSYGYNAPSYSPINYPLGIGQGQYGYQPQPPQPTTYTKEVTRYRTETKTSQETYTDIETHRDTLIDADMVHLIRQGYNGNHDKTYTFNVPDGGGLAKFSFDQEEGHILFEDEAKSRGQNQPGEDVDIYLEIKDGNQWKQVAKFNLPDGDQPDDSVKTYTFEKQLQAGDYRMRVTHGTPDYTDSIGSTRVISTLVLETEEEVERQREVTKKVKVPYTETIQVPYATSPAKQTPSYYNPVSPFAFYLPPSFYGQDNTINPYSSLYNNTFSGSSGSSSNHTNPYLGSTFDYSGLMSMISELFAYGGTGNA